MTMKLLHKALWFCSFHAWYCFLLLPHLLFFESDVTMRSNAATYSNFIRLLLVYNVKWCFIICVSVAVVVEVYTGVGWWDMIIFGRIFRVVMVLCDVACSLADVWLFSRREYVLYSVLLALFCQKIVSLLIFLQYPSFNLDKIQLWDFKVASNPFWMDSGTTCFCQKSDI